LRHSGKGLPISFSVRIDLPLRLIAGADFQVLSMNEIRPGPWPTPHAWQTSANTRSAVSSPAGSRLVIDEAVAFEARLAGMIRGRPAGARIAHAVRAGAHAFLREAATGLCLAMHGLQPASSAIVLRTRGVFAKRWSFPNGRMYG
jgi:hypothetical protein